MHFCKKIVFFLIIIITTMWKNIIIGLLIIISILSLTYGIFEKNRSRKFESCAFDNEKLVRETSIKLDEQMRIADSCAMIAMQQKKIAEEQKCIAETNALEAMKQKKIAEEQKRIMENSLIEAERAKKEAEKLYNEKQKK